MNFWLNVGSFNRVFNIQNIQNYFLRSSTDYHGYCLAVLVPATRFSYDVPVMADGLLLRAVKGQAKSLNLSNKGIEAVPTIIGRVRSLQTLTLKGNRLKDLPKETVALQEVCVY